MTKADSSADARRENVQRLAWRNFECRLPRQEVTCEVAILSRWLLAFAAALCLGFKAF